MDIHYEYATMHKHVIDDSHKNSKCNNVIEELKFPLARQEHKKVGFGVKGSPRKYRRQAFAAKMSHMCCIGL